MRIEKDKRCPRCGDKVLSTQNIDKRNAGDYIEYKWLKCLNGKCSWEMQLKNEDLEV